MLAYAFRPALVRDERMDSLCVKQKVGRETENRGRKALRATLEEMAEHNHPTQAAHGARESPPVEQGRDVQPGRLGKLLRSVHLGGCVMRPGKRTQQTALPG